MAWVSIVFGHFGSNFTVKCSGDRFRSRLGTGYLCGRFGRGSIGGGGGDVTREHRSIGSVDGGDGTTDGSSNARCGFGLAFAIDTWTIANSGTIGIGGTCWASIRTGFGSIDYDIHRKNGTSGTSGRRSLEKDKKTMEKLLMRRWLVKWLDYEQNKTKCRRKTKTKYCKKIYIS